MDSLLLFVVKQTLIHASLNNEKADLPTPSSYTFKGCNFTATQNLPRIVMPQLKTNIRKDRNINRLSIHYASTTLALC